MQCSEPATNVDAQIIKFKRSIEGKNGGLVSRDLNTVEDEFIETDKLIGN